MRVKTLLGGLAALLILGGPVVVSVPAQAQRWEDCHDRIDHAQRHLDHMIDRFGYRSEAAREARHELEDTRDWCYSHHRDRWDPGFHIDIPFGHGDYDHGGYDHGGYDHHH
jgi:hypothetical protein